MKEMKGPILPRSCLMHGNGRVFLISGKCTSVLETDGIPSTFLLLFFCRNISTEGNADVAEIYDKNKKPASFEICVTQAHTVT